jgi:hypothetical protein
LEPSVIFDWEGEARRRRLAEKAWRRAVRELGPSDPDVLRRPAKKLLRRFLEDPYQS